MARRVFVFNHPDGFVAGTVGDPGSRAFFLQARQGGAIVSVGIEKVQVAALAARLEGLLDAVGARSVAGVPDGDGLTEPLVELFRVGAMALTWDATTGAVVIEVQTPTESGEYVELPDDAEIGPDVLRVHLEPTPARMFARRAAQLVAAGRPACPRCGAPLDQRGHFCALGNPQHN